MKQSFLYSSLFFLLINTHSLLFSQEMQAERQRTSSEVDREIAAAQLQTIKDAAKKAKSSDDIKNTFAVVLTQDQKEWNSIFSYAIDPNKKKRALKKLKILATLLLPKIKELKDRSLIEELIKQFTTLFGPKALFTEEDKEIRIVLDELSKHCEEIAIQAWNKDVEKVLSREPKEWHAIFSDAFNRFPSTIKMAALKILAQALLPKIQDFTDVISLRRFIDKYEEALGAKNYVNKEHVTYKALEALQRKDHEFKKQHSNLMSGSLGRKYGRALNEAAQDERKLEPSAPPADPSSARIIPPFDWQSLKQKDKDEEAKRAAMEAELKAKQKTQSAPPPPPRDDAVDSAPFSRPSKPNPPKRSTSLKELKHSDSYVQNQAPLRAQDPANQSINLKTPAKKAALTEAPHPAEPKSKSEQKTKVVADEPSKAATGDVQQPTGTTALPAITTKKEAKNHYRRAKESYKNSDLASARELFEKVSKQEHHPRSQKRALQRLRDLDEVAKIAQWVNQGNITLAALNLYTFLNTQLKEAESYYEREEYERAFVLFCKLRKQDVHVTAKEHAVKRLAELLDKIGPDKIKQCVVPTAQELDKNSAPVGELKEPGKLAAHDPLSHKAHRQDQASMILINPLKIDDLQMAIRNGKSNEVEQLIKTELLVNAKDAITGKTTLHCAASRGHAELVKLLIDAGADVHAKDPSSWTALARAAQKGHVDAMKQLIAAKANVDVRGIGGWTILHDIVTSENTEAARVLIEAGAHVNAKSTMGTTVLKKAVESGHPEMVKLLIQAGANVHARNKNSSTLLHIASANCRSEVVKVLIEAGALIDTKDLRGQTALHNAASAGHSEVVKLLLAANADEDVRDHYGFPALYYALTEGHTEVSKLLINSGASLHFENGFDALHIAAAVGNAEIVELLIAANTDLKALSAGLTALHYAASEGQAETVKLLIAAKCDVNAEDECGRTPLHYAAYEGHVEVVRLLLEAKADITANACGSKALHLAAHEGRPEVVKLLLSAGDDSAATDKNGKTAFDYAKSKGHDGIVKLLMEAQSRKS